MAQIQPARGKFWWESVCWWLNNIFYNKGEKQPWRSSMCTEEKKTENKQNKTAGINETNKMIKRSTKQKIEQNSWKKKIHKGADYLMLKQAGQLETCPSYTRPQKCQIYIRNKHLTHSIFKKNNLKLMLYLGLTWCFFNQSCSL